MRDVAIVSFSQLPSVKVMAAADEPELVQPVTSDAMKQVGLTQDDIAFTSSRSTASSTKRRSRRRPARRCSRGTEHDIVIGRSGAPYQLLCTAQWPERVFMSASRKQARASPAEEMPVLVLS